MLTRERKAVLLDRLARDGRIVARDVARELGLSDDTVRRDLRELAAEGKLQRVHGGALPASPAVAGFAARRGISTEAKARLATRAVALIEPGQLVFLDGGTTNVELARRLPPDLAITVVTHSPSVAVALADHPAVAVDLIGGRLFGHSVVALGATAAIAIGRVRPDLFVMGVTGLHPEAGATTGDREEAEIKALIAARSAETMVLASAEKLGAASPHEIVAAAQITTILVEPDAPGDMLDALRALGPSVLVG
jgi:DeoR/GlpR family transcriptional regulator of sugar metabolism